MKDVNNNVKNSLGSEHHTGCAGMHQDDRFGGRQAGGG